MSFSDFRLVRDLVASEPSNTAKSQIIGEALDEVDEDWDLHVWIRLLLPGLDKRTYNMQNKKMVKLWAKIFGLEEDELMDGLEKQQVADVFVRGFERSKGTRPKKMSKITVGEVDEFLERLSRLSKEDEQEEELRDMAEMCTVEDLRVIVMLIKRDLRMDAGPKTVLDGLHEDAYEAFNSSRDLELIVDKVCKLRRGEIKKGEDPFELEARPMRPLRPMTANPCKSSESAFEKLPGGVAADLKYDGERVQVHRQMGQILYFSRSMKPVLDHKVEPFDCLIPMAFPGNADLILDAEVVMIEDNSGEILPFGTLGIHKAAEHEGASPCLFIFDCLFYGGESLLDKPLKERRAVLEKHLVEIGNQIRLSELKFIESPENLDILIEKIIQEKTHEGLVLKDKEGPYEPGKRRWLKMKREYLGEGKMADSADLVVLGAYYGTGRNSGLMSIFLMGCRGEKSGKWHTVTKVHTGLDDETLEALQEELGPNMVKIRGNYSQLPIWIDCRRSLVPDFVVKDPLRAPVWEIAGAEFTKSEAHTADGISIRFPRVVRRRTDLRPSDSSTTLEDLRDLYTLSK